MNQIDDSLRLLNKRLIRITYNRLADGFHIQTVDQRALALPIDWTFAKDHWEATISTLPVLDKVRWIKFRIKQATKIDQKRAAQKYSELLQLRAQLDKLVATVNRKEEDLITFLKDKGTNLKPAAPDDREMFLSEFSKRLHHQLALKTKIDDQMVMELAKRYPSLRKAIYTTQVKRVDRAKLNQILPNLDKKIAKMIASIDTTYRFMEIELKKPECVNCGGDVYRHTGICRRCGHEHQVNPTKAMRKWAKVA